LEKVALSLNKVIRDRDLLILKMCMVLLVQKEILASEQVHLMK